MVHLDSLNYLIKRLREHFYAVSPIVGVVLGVVLGLEGAVVTVEVVLGLEGDTASGLVGFTDDGLEGVIVAGLVGETVTGVLGFTEAGFVDVFSGFVVDFSGDEGYGGLRPSENNPLSHNSLAK